MVVVHFSCSFYCILAAKMMQLCRLKYCGFLSCRISCKIWLDMLKWTVRSHFFLCFSWSLKIAKYPPFKISLYVRLKCSLIWTFLFYALEECKSLVIPWQGGTCLVCLSTESNTNIEYIYMHMYRVNALVTVNISILNWPKLNSLAKT
jgi:hypothetical protein